MSVERWTIYVCQECGKKVEKYGPPHRHGGVLAEIGVVEVVPASHYEALRDGVEKEIERLRAAQAADEELADKHRFGGLRQTHHASCANAEGLAADRLSALLDDTKGEGG
jgi:hypothetical protein